LEALGDLTGASYKIHVYDRRTIVKCCGSEGLQAFLKAIVNAEAEKYEVT
jgi:hypothetical protein